MYADLVCNVLSVLLAYVVSNIETTCNDINNDQTLILDITGRRREKKNLHPTPLPPLPFPHPPPPPHTHTVRLPYCSPLPTPTPRPPDARNCMQNPWTIIIFRIGNKMPGDDQQKKKKTCYNDLPRLVAWRVDFTAFLPPPTPAPADSTLTAITE